jgi:hypothetical protein
VPAPPIAQAANDGDQAEQDPQLYLEDEVQVDYGLGDDVYFDDPIGTLPNVPGSTFSDMSG